MSDTPGINGTTFYMEFEKDCFVQPIRKQLDFDNIFRDMILFGSAKVSMENPSEVEINDLIKKLGL